MPDADAEQPGDGAVAKSGHVGEPRPAGRSAGAETPSPNSADSERQPGGDDRAEGQQEDHRGGERCPPPRGCRRPGRLRDRRRRRARSAARRRRRPRPASMQRLGRSRRGRRRTRRSSVEPRHARWTRRGDPRRPRPRRRCPRAGGPARGSGRRATRAAGAPAPPAASQTTVIDWPERPGKRWATSAAAALGLRSLRAEVGGEVAGEAAARGRAWPRAARPRRAPPTTGAGRSGGRGGRARPRGGEWGAGTVMPACSTRGAVLSSCSGRLCGTRRCVRLQRRGPA